jgi:hypothetical protein
MHARLARGRRQASAQSTTHLLHDTGLSLGKGNVATRLVGDKLYLNFSSLTATGIIIIVAVVGSRRTRALYAANLTEAGTIANTIVITRGQLFVLIGDFVRHCSGFVELMDGLGRVFFS